MSDRAALVLVTTSYPTSADGSEAAGSFVSDFAEALAGHVPVRVVAPGDIQAVERRNGVDVFRYAAPTKPLSTLKPWVPADWRSIKNVLRSGGAATAAAVQYGPAAHILALWALPSGHWAQRVSRLTGVPYSVWTLGSDIWTLGRIPLVRRRLREVLRDATRCYSDGLQLAEDTRRIGERNVEFLPSTRRIEGRRTAMLKQAPPYRLLFLGRWHRNKGVDLLLDALARLDDRDWQGIEQVDVCGGGAMEAHVRAAVAALQAASRPVVLRGFLAKPEAEAALTAADYLLIPSRIESIPVVFSDAMKLDCPVVAMPVGDLAALVGTAPECGIVADDVSAAAYAQALRRAIARAPSAFVDGVLERAGRFNLPHLATRLLTGLAAADASADPRWGNRQRDRKAQAIWSTLVKTQGEDIGSGTWLDIGCGSGGIAHDLASHATHVIGVDPEPWTAWQNMVDESSNLEFRVARCDETDPPAPACSIDVAICNQVYEHVADPAQLIRNIATMLKPGGCCYFAGPNLLWPVEPHVYWPFVHWLPRGMAQRLMRRLGSRHADDLDAYSSDYWQLVRWFREAGLISRNGLATRLRCELEIRGLGKAMPRGVQAIINGMAPASPGFVFLLVKP